MTKAQADAMMELLQQIYVELQNTNAWLQRLVTK